MMAELLDLAKDLVDVAGIFAEDAALEHQCVGLATPVPHLTVPGDPLVGVNANEVRPPQFCGPHIGDLKIGRMGMDLYPIGNLGVAIPYFGSGFHWLLPFFQKTLSAKKLLSSAFVKAKKRTDLGRTRRDKYPRLFLNHPPSPSTSKVKTGDMIDRDKQIPHHPVAQHPLLIDVYGSEK